MSPRDGWISLDAVDGWEALVTILLLAGAYVLGILVDRLADNAFGLLRGPDRPGFAKKRLEVLHTSPGMAPFLEYQRSRLRVARGTLFNLVAATVSSAAFLIWGTDVDALWLFAILGVALAALPVSAVATMRIAEAYEKRLVDAHAALAELTAETAQA